MKAFLTAALIWIVATLPGVAQQAEIEGVISDQIAALQQDDFEKAFTFASPNIKRIFRTPENFGVMVRRGYPMVWRPAAVEFRDLKEINGDLWQQVLIRDVKGASFMLGYRMEEVSGEGWKIAGVQLIKAPDVAA